jgi:chemotaxis protein methyltransferase CheR
MQLDEQSFSYLSDLVIKTMGIKMPAEKKQLLETRLSRRVSNLNLTSFAEYCAFLKKNDDNARIELNHFYNSVSTNKTDFFREISHFDYLRTNVLPEIKNSNIDNINIWSCASSSGEELYSIAIEIEEFTSKNRGTFNYNIIGTDISTKVLAIAKEGIYKKSVIEPVPPAIRKKYFKENKQDSETMIVNDYLKKKIKLGTFNLMSRNYNIPGQFNIIFCRNVLIYFERDKQQYILNNLIDKLLPGGYLFLGHSESMAGMNLNLKTCAPAVFKKQ